MPLCSSRSGYLQYPGSFDLKIIGVDDDTFVSDIRKAVAGCLTNGEDSVIKCSTREKGKYTSITIKVRVDNSTQLYKVTLLPSHLRVCAINGWQGSLLGSRLSTQLLAL